ncbi:MAG: ABC transporter permease [Planctomycetota bacterium]
MSQPPHQTTAERRSPVWLRGVVRPAAPLLLGVVVLGVWEAGCRMNDVPQYVLPAPSRIAADAAESKAELIAAAGVTLRTTLIALALAVASGVLMALVFTSSRIVELSLYPYAVILQVTPLVAVAPLLIVWIEQPWAVMIVCAWIVAFFPMLSGTVTGLRSADRGLVDLFTLYGATPWQRFRLLLAPSALPYFLSGLRVSVNLSLIGAVVGELVTGAGADQPGLASTVLDAQIGFAIDHMFAALGTISLLGVVLFFATHLLTQSLLGRWHESALPDSR